MRWFCSVANLNACLRFIARSPNLSHARQIHDSSNSWLDVSQLSCECFCFRFPIKISCLISLLDMRLVRNRVFVMKYSYEYNKDSILIVNNKFDWFFRLEMLETIYSEEILHCRISRPNFDRYIHSDLAASRADSRNRLIQTNF